MSQTVDPMFHVPSVAKTMDWYVSHGFALVGENREAGKVNWAKVALGDSVVMFNAGGRASAEHRREVDLYVTTADLSDWYERLKDRVDVVEHVHETEHGMREFIIRDVNRFWITFGEPIRT